MFGEPFLLNTRRTLQQLKDSSEFLKKVIGHLLDGNKPFFDFRGKFGRSLVGKIGEVILELHRTPAQLEIQLSPEVLHSSGVVVVQLL